MDLKSFVQLKKNPKIPDFRPGDSVRVMARVVEGERERVQAFEGVVIRKRRGGVNSNFTVRRVSHGIGVERTFMLHSPRLESVKVVRVGRVRRAKLYYLRQLVGKKARIRVGSRDRFEELTRELAKEVADEDVGAADELEVEAEAAEEEEAEGEAEGEPEEAEGEEEAEAEEAEAEEPTAEAEEEVKAESEEAEKPAAEGEAEPEEAEPKPDEDKASAE
ncbi:MAG: 50S ribosomal protein L19 [Chloroflexi bacterium]|nr:50S ribosomal protein L19 [Chloroflexota bacterium]